MPHSVNDSTATMSRPSSTSTTSANLFPRPAGATLLAPGSLADQLSPARSTFSFDSSPKSVQAVGFDDTRHMTPVSRGAPGEKKGSDAIGQRQQNHGQRRRTQYYEEQFAYKEDSTSSARDRVTKDAPIIADLRTNVIIKDEYTLVTDLSHHLSQRYQRPESSIMITVNHSACLLLGGSFEPTYVVTISALPVQLQPTTNKRNAALIQTFMFESIGVHAERGIIKFVPIAEECLATNGMTVRGEIERMERQQAEETGGLKQALTKSSKRSAVTKAKSSFQLSRNSSIPSPGPFDSGVAVNDNGKEPCTPLQPVDSVMTKRSSMKAKSSNQLKEKSWTNMVKPTPPPIPEDTPAPKIGKRKSLMAMFKR